MSRSPLCCLVIALGGAKYPLLSRVRTVVRGKSVE